MRDKGKRIFRGSKDEEKEIRLVKCGKTERRDEMQSMGKRKHREEKVGQDTWKGSYTVEAAVILPLTALF